MLSPALLDAAFIVLVLCVAFTIVVGFGEAARRSHGAAAIRPAHAAAVALAVIGGLALLDAVAARSGWASRWSELPPRIPALAFVALMAATAVLRLPPTRRLLPLLAPAGLVAFHTFRFPLELLLWALARAHRLPASLTFEGQNFDVLVGLSAPWVAWALARRHIGWRTITVWNLASLGLLVNVTSLAIRSAPGPLHAFADAAPLTLVATLPYTWLPGLLVPAAYVGHLLSLRWALAERSRTAQARSHDDLAA